MGYYFDNISILENNLLFDDMVFDSYNRAKIIWKLDHSNKITKEMEKYNIYDGYSVYMRMPHIKKIISFHFGTIGQSSEIYKYYLNHDEEFSKFFNYFTAEIGSNALSTLASFYSNNIKILMKKYLNIKYDVFNLSVKRYEIEYNGVKQKISQKEYACLALLSQGKTAKDIAEHLEISHRTVETHLLNIKYKYNRRIFMKKIFGLFLVVFSLRSFGSDLGIHVYEDFKLIVLDGNENPNKTNIEGVRVTELSGFATESTNFNWYKYADGNYEVKIINTNIHVEHSVRCLLWFIHSNFKVELGASSFISLRALEDFSYDVRARNRNENEVGNIKFSRLPWGQGFSEIGRLDNAKSILKDKGYMIDSN